MSAQCDLLIRGGMVIDPERNVFEKADIAIVGDKIAVADPCDNREPKKIIDASGCLVMPGLIDYHTHVFHGGTSIGISADSTLLPQGVTTAVDQGSAGANNVESFFRTVVNNSQVKVFAYLHVSPAGLATLPHCLEPIQPGMFDVNSASRVFEKFGKKILGLKIRQSREVVGELGLKPLISTVKMADELGCRVVVHTTNPPGNVEELAELLRPGDVFTHMYQGRGSHIMDANGEVRPAIRAARKRGVLFDTADGRVHYAYSVARAALAAGFEPDIISTDLTGISMLERSVFGLPWILSKYLNLGMALPNVVRTCTSSPARLLGMQGKLGTLSPGACADVAIFKLKEMALEHRDSFNEALQFKQGLVPMITVLDGKVVYRNFEAF